jgi:hypothetical protein
MRFSPRKIILIAGGLLLAVAILILGMKKILGKEQSYRAFILPYSQGFEDVKLNSWLNKSGVWTIRDSTLAQTIGGEQAAQIFLPFKLIEDAPYHASVYLTIKKDTRAVGFAFNAQYPDLTEKQQRVYLAQPEKDKLELVSGYVDDMGSFIAQERVPISVNTTDFRLDLFVYSDTYLVQLNGQRLIEKRPLFYHNGMLGFYTIGSVIFDNFMLTAADNTNPGDLVYTSDFNEEPGGAGWVPFDGDWRIQNQQMTQNDPAVYDAGIGYETSTYENYTLQVVFNHINEAGAGVLFNMPSPYQVNGAHMVRYSNETDALIWGYYDPQGKFNRQGYVQVAAPGTLLHSLKIFSGEISYDIFLDDQLIARSVPLHITRGCVGLSTSRASAAYTSVEVFPLFGSNNQTSRQLTPVITKPPVTPGPTIKTVIPANSEVNTGAPTKTPPAPTPTQSGNLAAVGGSYTANFSGDINASGWRIITGKWSFSNGDLNQTNSSGIDMSIVYTPAVFTNFTLEAGLTHQRGFGGGILFDMPEIDRLNGAYLVRYSDRRAGAIFWGHYDDKGVFVGEGYTNVPEASTDRHVFRIVSKDSTYDIYLDNSLIIKNLPLLQNSGHVGLLTTSASVAFDTLTVKGSNAATVSPVTRDWISDVKILSGKWDTTDSNNITQLVTDLGDYVLNSGISARQYTLEATISLPDGGDTGGGFIFHIPDPKSRNGAYIVRLIKGGQGVFWGRFDDAGKFQGDGSKTITTAAHYLLKLAVTNDKLDVYVNNQPIFNNLKLNRSEGWLGLIAHGGVVKFEDVKINISDAAAGTSGGP